MDRADQIWNNSVASEPASTLPGDVALHAVILFHGVVQNGGVLHAMESLNMDERQAAKNGFVWFGLVAVAELMGELGAQADTDALTEREMDVLEVETNERYNAAVPDDETLEAALRTRLADLPDAFADRPQRRGWRKLIGR